MIAPSALGQRRLDSATAPATKTCTANTPPPTSKHCNGLSRLRATATDQRHQRRNNDQQQKHKPQQAER